MAQNLILVGLLEWQYKVCAWLSVFSCMISVANVKSSEVVLKQIACSMM